MNTWEHFVENETIQHCSDFLVEQEYDEADSLDILQQLFETNDLKPFVTLNGDARILTLHPGFKHAWFNPKHEQLQALMSQYQETTLESDSDWVYRLTKVIAPFFSDFIYLEEDGELLKLDRFIRECVSNETSTSFLIGGIVGMKA